MEIGEKIHRLRIENDLTLEELGNKIGVGKSTVRKWEKGIIANMRRDKISAIANALGTTPAYLMGWDDIDTTSSIKGVKIPVLGKVAAGIPIEAVEDIVDYEEITEAMARKGEYFGLQIQGDSMEPKFTSGDIVIVRKQDNAETGDIVIATVNGHDATCKRLQKYAEGLALISTNPIYEPFHFTSKEVNDTPVKILGKVVELRAKF